MRVRPEKAFPDAARGGISTAALLLAFCCAPALASTGVEDIAIDVVDPGTASSVVAVELNPRVASILREIFEETVPGGQAVEHATPASLPQIRCASAHYAARFPLPIVTRPTDGHQDPHHISRPGHRHPDHRPQSRSIPGRKNRPCHRPADISRACR